jgi:hypothetical protein
MFAKTHGGTKFFFSEIATLEKKFGGGKILTRIAITTSLCSEPSGV